MLPCSWIRCCTSARPIEPTASNHTVTNASSSMFQSTIWILATYDVLGHIRYCTRAQHRLAAPPGGGDPPQGQPPDGGGGGGGGVARACVDIADSLSAVSGSDSGCGFSCLYVTTSSSGSIPLPYLLPSPPRPAGRRPAHHWSEGSGLPTLEGASAR